MAKIVQKDCRSVCPIANALDLVGDRWTLLIIRDMLFFGRHEYHEFLNAAEGISTNILSERLKRLSESGIAGAVVHPKDKKRKLYYLTDRGKELLPIMLEMAMWGGAHLEASAPALAKVREAKKNPAAFKKKRLKALSDWEAENLK